MNNGGTWLWGSTCALVAAALVRVGGPERRELAPPGGAVLQRGTTSIAQDEVVPVRIHFPYGMAGPQDEGERNEDRLREFWTRVPAVNYAGGGESVGGYGALLAAPYQSFSHGVMRSLQSRKDSDVNYTPLGNVDASWGWLKRQVDDTRDGAGLNTESFGEGSFRLDGFGRPGGDRDRMGLRNDLFGDSVLEGGR